MITRAKFENFKALRDVEITFDSRLTVLVGPNGSGKTSVLQGIHLFGQFLKHYAGPQRFYIPAEQVRIPSQRYRGSQWVYGWGGELPILADERSLAGCHLSMWTRAPDNSEILSQYRGMSMN